MNRFLLVPCIVLSLVVSATAADPSPAANDRAALEKEFEKKLSGCVFRGYFTARDAADKALKEEKYTISKVEKAENLPGHWTFHARIQYGGHDVTLPLTLEVSWAGDTPVITLTDLLVPGFGKFTCRVLVFRDQYAGTWDGGGNHGGHLFGTIEPAK